METKIDSTNTHITNSFRIIKLMTDTVVGRHVDFNWNKIDKGWTFSLNS